MGLNGVPNLIFDQNSRSNEFVPNLWLFMYFFVPKSFIHVGALNPFTLLILSIQSLLVCILNSKSLLTCIWMFALEHKDKYSNKWGGQVSKAQALCILKEYHGG